MAAPTNASEPIVGINVTPFVDVVLVLLIIFMATSSYVATAAIQVDLPRAESGGEVVATTLALIIAADGTLYLNGEPSDGARIADHCRAASARHEGLQALIAADGEARHRQVVELIDLLKLNGVVDLALNVAPAAIAPRR